MSNSQMFRDTLAQLPNEQIPALVASMAVELSEIIERDALRPLTPSIVSIAQLQANLQFLAELVSVLATRVGAS